MAAILTFWTDLKLQENSNIDQNVIKNNKER